MRINTTASSADRITYTGTANWHICPDLLSIRDIGAADGWRGKVVRGFFRLLKVVTGV